LSEPSEILSHFLIREGIGDKTSQRKWFERGQVLINSEIASHETPICANDTLSVRGRDYQILESKEPGRLIYRVSTETQPPPIKGKIRVQCGYHKCMTMYFRRISKKTVRWNNPISGSFRHFFHRADEFYHDCADYTLSSISGHCLDLDRFENIRAVHIIRDPRDMLISGYFYHLKASESWCHYQDPTNEDWAVVNAQVPENLPAGTSLKDYLESVSIEEGLAAEMDLRQFHFDNMLDWPTDDERVLTIRYDELMGNEAETFRRIYDFYGFVPQTRWAAAHYANKYSITSAHRHGSHIRNPKAGQWKRHFTPDLERMFNERFGALLEKYGY
jgi:hypothetical protein